MTGQSHAEADTISILAGSARVVVRRARRACAVLCPGQGHVSAGVLRHRLLGACRSVQAGRAGSTRSLHSGAVEFGVVSVARRRNPRTVLEPGPRGARAARARPTTATTCSAWSSMHTCISIHISRCSPSSDRSDAFDKVNPEHHGRDARASATGFLRGEGARGLVGSDGAARTTGDHAGLGALRLDQRQLERAHDA